MPCVVKCGASIFFEDSLLFLPVEICLFSKEEQWTGVIYIHKYEKGTIVNFIFDRDGFVQEYQYFSAGMGNALRHTSVRADTGKGLYPGSKAGNQDAGGGDRCDHRPQ